MQMYNQMQYVHLCNWIGTIITSVFIFTQIQADDVGEAW